jgi:hypothetical protein
MANEVSTSGSGAAIPAAFLESFGAAATLTTAECKLHEFLFAKFAQTVRPRDIIECIFVRDAADIQLEVQRYRRLMTGIVVQARKDARDEFATRVTFELTKEAATARSEAQAQLALEINQIKGDADHVKAETERLKTEFTKMFQVKVSDLDAQSQRRIKEFTQQLEAGEKDAGLFEQYAEPYHQASRLLAAAERRFAKVLSDLDLYRTGLGEGLAQAAEVIDAEFEDADPAGTQSVESVPIAPITGSFSGPEAG